MSANKYSNILNIRFVLLFCILLIKVNYSTAIPYNEHYGEYEFKISTSIESDQNTFTITYPLIEYTLFDSDMRSYSIIESTNFNTDKSAYNDIIFRFSSKWISTHVDYKINSRNGGFVTKGQYGAACTSCGTERGEFYQYRQFNNDLNSHTARETFSKTISNNSTPCQQCRFSSYPTSGPSFTIKYNVISTITYTPVSIDLYYYNVTDKLTYATDDTKIDNTSTDLPSDDAMSILPTKNFPSDTYQFVFQTTKSKDVSYFLFTDALYSTNPNNPYINTTGIDLFGNREIYKTLIAENEKIIISNNFNNTKKEQKKLVLNPILSAPSITTSITPPLCFGDSGIVTVSLDEILESDFQIFLSIISKENKTYTFEELKFTSLNTECQFKVAAGDQVTIKTSGSWTDYKGIQHSYYCDAPRHKAEVVMPEAPEPVTIKIDSENNVKCHGGNDGSIYFTAGGGTGEIKTDLFRQGINDIIDSSTDGHSFSNLSAGSYRILATDKKNCKSDSYNVTITEPDAIRFEASATDATIFDKADGALNIKNIAGGVAPYTATWERTLTTENGSYIIPHESNENICINPSLKAGNYSVDVTDSNGCHAPTPVAKLIISQPPKLVIDDIKTTKNILCHGDRGFDGATVQAYVSGGVTPYTYRWTDSSDYEAGTSSVGEVRTQLPAGTYNLRVTDKNGAVTSTAFNVKEPDAIDITTIVSHVKCMGDNNGAIHLDVSGGTPPYAYSWSSLGEAIANSNAIDGISDGDYSITITDANKCQMSRTETVNVQSDIKIDNTLKRDVSCHGLSDGEVSYMINGGVTPYTVTWQDETSVTECTVDKKNIKAGTYSMTVTDNIGCTQRLNVLIDQPEKIEIGVPENVKLCKEQTRVITPENSDSQLTFKWYKDGNLLESEPSINISQQGIYKIKASDGSCTDSAFVHVTESDDLINCDWLVASKAPVGSAVRLVNITHENAERWIWVYDASPDVTLADEGERFADLVFNQTGTYTVGLKTFYNGCEMTTMKSVEIVDAGADIGDYLETTPLITRFDVSPNPSDGNIVITLELSQIEKALIDFYDIVNGRKVAPQIVLEGHKSYRKETSLSLNAGIYYLTVTFESSRLRQTFKLIVR